MSQSGRNPAVHLGTAFGLCLATFLCGVLTGFAEEPPTPTVTKQEQTGRSPQPGQPSARHGIQERGLPTVVVAPAVPQRRTLSPGDRLSAPTPSVTLVANGIQLKHKSVTTIVTAPANLPVTVPVEISVGYFSPAGSRRFTQTYASATGNRLLYNDPVADAKPRLMRLDITLRELGPGGQGFSFSLPIDIIPLYDVDIGPMRFYLDHPCDMVGQSEIDLRWFSPEGQLHTASFSMDANPEVARHIVEFAWSRHEISAAADLHEPSVFFYENDPGFSFHPNRAPLQTNLLPGTKPNFDYFLNEGSINPQRAFIDHDKCQARVTYAITRNLLMFPHL